MPDNSVVSTDSKPLTDQEIRILSYVEQCFWEHGYLPTNEFVSDKLKIPKASITRAWNKSNFRQALRARGVDLDPTATEGVLLPAQILLANVLLNAHDKSSIRQKLELCQVTSQQYNAWMRQPAFANYIRKRAEKAFGDLDWKAYQAFDRAMEGGDVQAATKYLEIRGIYNPKMQVDVNIDQIVVQLIEIVSRRVTDPLTLQLIADDVEALLSGNKRQALPVESTEVMLSLSASEAETVIDI